MNEKNIKIFQIFYNEETRALLDPAFIPLDNSDNPRPDWSEYWPIRGLLNGTQFNDEDYIGIFSPRFGEKTQCSGAEVINRILSFDAEVYSFSPSFDQIALHLNPFEHGERKHPGLIPRTEQLLATLSIDLDIRNLVCGLGTTIFANYFVARSRIWKEWFALSEKIFALCETNEGELATQLNASTRHREASAYPMKVFVMERLITIVLLRQHLTARYCLDLAPGQLQPTTTAALHGWLLTCDSLKGQYLRTGDNLYLQLFLQVRAQLFGQLGLQLPALASA